MANQNGNMYGLTILSPIIDDPNIRISHDTALRMYLQRMPRHERSPFARVSGTHMCRLVVMDDVVFVGSPAREEHLQSKYLIFNSNLYGELNPYLEQMARTIPDVVEDIWSHCVGYPGADPAAFAAYMQKCQVETTFYFADVNGKNVAETLLALQRKVEFAAFIEQNQGQPPAELQRQFAAFWDRVRKMEPPLPGLKRLEKGQSAGA